MEEIIGKENACELRGELQDMVCAGASYDDIEDMMLGYGLEMDYIFDLL